MNTVPNSVFSLFLLFYLMKKIYWSEENMKFFDKNYDNVIALTIVNSETLESGNITDDSEVWVCQRHDNHNKSHPNSVSIPTQRTPIAIMKDLVKLKKGTKILPAYETLNSDPCLNYAIESILSKKLGLARELYDKHLEFKAIVTKC